MGKGTKTGDIKTSAKASKSAKGSKTSKASAKTSNAQAPAKVSKAPANSKAPAKVSKAPVKTKLQVVPCHLSFTGIPYYRRSLSVDDNRRFGLMVKVVPGPEPWLVGFSLVVDGYRGVTDGNVRIWDGKKVRALDLSPHAVAKGLWGNPAVAFAPDARALYLAAGTDLVEVTLGKKPSVRRIEECGEYGCLGVDIAPDGRIAYVNREGLVLLDPATGTRAHHTLAFEADGVRFLLDGRGLAILGEGNVLVMAVAGVDAAKIGVVKKELEDTWIWSYEGEVYVWDSARDVQTLSGAAASIEAYHQHRSD